MRRPVVAGNWKMHGTRAENAQLVDALIEASDQRSCDVVVCPPYVYLWEIGRQVKDSPVGLGAQNVCAEASGAFTGEVSAGDAQGRRLQLRDRRPLRAAAAVPRGRRAGRAQVRRGAG